MVTVVHSEADLKKLLAEAEFSLEAAQQELQSARDEAAAGRRAVRSVQGEVDRLLATLAQEIDERERLRHKLRQCVPPAAFADVQRMLDEANERTAALRQRLQAVRHSLDGVLAAMSARVVDMGGVRESVLALGDVVPPQRNEQQISSLEVAIRQRLRDPGYWRDQEPSIVAEVRALERQLESLTG